MKKKIPKRISKAARVELEQKKEAVLPSGGQPIWNEDTVDKLHDAFSIGCTIEEACIYAKIARHIFYYNCPVGTDLYNKFMQDKRKPLLVARQTVVKDLATNAETAKWYLKNKKSNEFNEKQTLEATIKAKFEYTPEEQKLLQSYENKGQNKNSKKG